jgi:beta-phosphoglucomutase
MIFFSKTNWKYKHTNNKYNEEYFFHGTFEVNECYLIVLLIANKLYNNFLNILVILFLMIKAILFDAEGVVIDTEDIWDKGAIIFLEKRGIKYDREKVKSLLTGQSMIDGVKIMQNLYVEKLTGDVKDLANERLEIIQKLFRTKIKFIPGFLEFYKNVSEKYKTCIATAMNKQLLKNVSEKLNLVSLFNKNIYSIDDVGGKSKPNPEIFLYSAKKLRVKPANCMVIEDAPHGITAAKRAGMYCVGITTTYSSKQLKDADQIVSQFKDIKIP